MVVGCFIGLDLVMFIVAVLGLLVVCVLLDCYCLNYGLCERQSHLSYWTIKILWCMLQTVCTIILVNSGSMQVVATNGYKIRSKLV